MGTTSSPEYSPPTAATRHPEQTPTRIGRYMVVRKLGQGGMGVVFAARDESLGRIVAVKTMSSLEHDETARKRFWREARAAASINHPNVCQLYEIGEDNGTLFIAMELLEGEGLAERLRRGPLNVSETVPIGLGVLSALSALHARGIIHRDLKPSNVFLTPHGVKLLDFGVARTAQPESPSQGGATELTQAGAIVGTPGYLAPEGLSGEPVEARSDLFAVGAVLFEMLAGRPAFTGRSMIEVLHAVLHEQPPALTGSPAVAAADRVIRRALAKRPEDRPASADAMAEALRAGAGADGAGARALARPLTRLVVLPFRVLRPDPDTEFLAFSLPDAIATSLSGRGSLVVRSSATAARFNGEAPDLKALAAEADVDRVVMGTLLRSGDQLRATAQLVEAPGGSLLTSYTAQAALGDLFRLQDDLARRVVEGLSLPLSDTGTTPTALATPEPRAYQFYLQANELSRNYDRLVEARDLYQRAIEVDPEFAPAWAQLGRCHWVIGRYITETPDSDTRAEDALRRALALNPRLSLAHKFYANLEAGVGHAVDALVRLLDQVAARGTDPELFAGLVHAGRYCGLLDQSVVAHEEARRLDPNVPTSVSQTLLMRGDYAALTAGGPDGAPGSADEVIRVIALGLAGQVDEARRVLADMRRAISIPAFQSWADFLLDWLERRPADASRRSAFAGLKISDDPESVFQGAWLLCDAGQLETGLPELQRGVAAGYFAAHTLSTSRSFDALRGEPLFLDLLRDAERGRDAALAAFREHGGERLLGK